jgi:hypothetical protein
MAAIQSNLPKSDNAIISKQSSSNQDKNSDNIPEIIEEKRRDSEGRTVIYKYARGKLLGKVRIY